MYELEEIPKTKAFRSFGKRTKVQIPSKLPTKGQIKASTLGECCGELDY